MTCTGNCPNIKRIETEIAELRRLVIGNRLSSEDHQLLKRLLPALAGLFGPEPFRSWQALCSPPIAAMIGTPGRLGTLLHYAASSGTSIDGLKILKVDKKIHGARLWRIVQG